MIIIKAYSLHTYLLMLYNNMLLLNLKTHTHIHQIHLLNWAYTCYLHTLYSHVILSYNKYIRMNSIQVKIQGENNRYMSMEICPIEMSH